MSLPNHSDLGQYMEMGLSACLALACIWVQFGSATRLHPPLATCGAPNHVTLLSSIKTRLFCFRFLVFNQLQGGTERKETTNYLWVQSSYKSPRFVSQTVTLFQPCSHLYFGKVLNLHSLLIGALAPGLHYFMYSHWNRILY